MKRLSSSPELNVKRIAPGSSYRNKGLSPLDSEAPCLQEGKDPSSQGISSEGHHSSADLCQEVERDEVQDAVRINPDDAVRAGTVSPIWDTQGSPC